MRVVHELRQLSAQPRSKTQLKARMSEEGIFSLFFASEYLLRDVVKDSTIDIMHVFLCGLTRYLLSWVTDHFIPASFEWADLNREKNKYKWLRGQRVPDLERSKGDARGCTSMHLSASETLHFALARCTERDGSIPPPRSMRLLLQPRICSHARPSHRVAIAK